VSPKVSKQTSELLQWLLFREQPALRHKAAVDGLVAKATVHHAWLLNNDLLHPRQHWLTLRTPLWSDMELVDILSQWHADWRCFGGKL